MPEGDKAVSVKTKKPHPMDTPGTKKWFWGMRVINVVLFILPLYPLADAVMNAREIKKLTGVDHPTALDYLFVTMPGLACFVMMVFISRALYRIEINYGSNANPYTARDKTMLDRAGYVAGSASVLVSLGIFGAWFHFEDFVPGDSLGVFVVAMTMLGYVRNSYVKGEKYYRELEKGV